MIFFGRAKEHTVKHARRCSGCNAKIEWTDHSGQEPNEVFCMDCIKLGKSTDRPRHRDGLRPYFRPDPCPLCGWIAVNAEDGICVNCNNIKRPEQITAEPARDGYCELCKLNPIEDQEEKLCMKCLVARARREYEDARKSRPMDLIGQATPRENVAHLGPNDPHFCSVCNQLFSNKQEYIDHHEKNCKARS